MVGLSDEIGTGFDRRAEDAVWAPEQRATVINCIASYIVESLDEDQLAVALTSINPVEQAARLSEEATSVDEQRVAGVNCIGSAEDFISIFTPQMAASGLVECFAPQLTVDLRVSTLWDDPVFSDVTDRWTRDSAITLNHWLVTL